RRRGVPPSQESDVPRACRPDLASEALGRAPLGQPLGLRLAMKQKNPTSRSSFERSRFKTPIGPFRMPPARLKTATCPVRNRDVSIRIRDVPVQDRDLPIPDVDRPVENADPLHPGSRRPG